MSEFQKIQSKRLILSNTQKCGLQKAYFIINERITGNDVGYAKLKLKATNEGLIGEIDLSIIKAYSGKGYSIEALKALSEFAYEELGLVKVVTKAPVMNLAAEYTLRKAGFAFAQKFTQDNQFKYFESDSPYFQA